MPPRPATRAREAGRPGGGACGAGGGSRRHREAAAAAAEDDGQEQSSRHAAARCAAPGPRLERIHEYFRERRQGTPGAHGRRHDGVQERARRGQGRHRAGPGDPAHARPGQGRQEGEPCRRRRAASSSRCPRTASPASSSRSTARPISSPVTSNFLAFAREAAALALAKAPADVAALLQLAAHRGRHAGGAAQGARGEDRREHQHAPLRTDRARRARSAPTSTARALASSSTSSGGDEELRRDLAMHVAASRPQCVSSDDVPAETLERERRILTEQAAQEGKPPEIVAKMVEGRLRKFLNEITLARPAVREGPGHQRRQAGRRPARRRCTAVRPARGRRGHREEVGKFCRGSARPARGPCLVPAGAAWTGRGPSGLRRYAIRRQINDPACAGFFLEHGVCGRSWRARQALWADSAQAQRRSAAGRRRLRHRPAHAGPHRQRDRRSSRGSASSSAS